tara:strand:+ start:1105 stop:1389 length:285 start_codon:yes stop_codon:yes gene_type:complete
MKQIGDQEKYPKGFFRWLESNRHIFREFERAGLRMAMRRSKYSARTIIETIRWETDLSDSSRFKINDRFTPGLARLWMHFHGEHYPGFFQLREH